MSTDLANISNNLPAEIREALAADIAADIGRIGSTGGKDIIRVTNRKTFELPNGDSVDELEAIVVHFVYRNKYYLSAYNAKKPESPACFSISESASAMIPSDNSPLKQSEACAVCQQNQFGSAQSGQGKACKNTVLLAVLPTDATDDTPIWLLEASPTAIKHFNSYVTKVARTAKVPVHAVVTKISFDDDSTYASLRFDAAGVNPVFNLTRSRREEAIDRLKEEPDVSAFEMPASRR